MAFFETQCILNSENKHAAVHVYFYFDCVFQVWLITVIAGQLYMKLHWQKITVI